MKVRILKRNREYKHAGGKGGRGYGKGSLEAETKRQARASKKTKASK